MHLFKFRSQNCKYTDKMTKVSLKVDIGGTTPNLKASDEPQDLKTVEIFDKPSGKSTGIQIPGYEYLKSFGVDKGGFGAEHLYRNIKTRAIVALKRVSYENDGKNIYRKALDQIERVTHIMHPNIVIFYEYFSLSKSREIFILKEYAEHGSLRNLLTEQIGKCEYIPEDIVIQIVRDIICGVRYLHLMNIALCVIKPENIMLSNNGYVKICDFGIVPAASRFNADDISTLSYTPPELFDGVLRPDEKAISWSVGILLYELCTFQHPFYPFGTADELLSKLKTGRYKSLSFHENEFSPGIQELMDWTVQPDRLYRKNLISLMKHPLIRIKPSVHFFVFL